MKLAALAPEAAYPGQAAGIEHGKTEDRPWRHHPAGDQSYSDRFEEMFCRDLDIFVTRSVQIGDIVPGLKTETIRQRIRDAYLRDATVTVVLIGQLTWQRKHVDWEISSSIRRTQYNPRSGFLGILLPTFTGLLPGHYDPFTVPPCLHDNVACGFARIYPWSEDPDEVGQWIHEAFMRRDTVEPDNSFPLHHKNRSGLRWQR